MDKNSFSLAPLKKKKESFSWFSHILFEEQVDYLKRKKMKKIFKIN